MWFRIIKQGKILTLPKTQLRIKKPDNVEEERNCKDKLIDYSNKLGSIAMNLIASNIKNSLIKPTELDNPNKVSINHTEYAKIHNHIHKVSITNFEKDTNEGWRCREEIKAATTDRIEMIPEKVCCAALDLLSSVSDENAVRSGKMKQIDEWGIHAWKSERKWHNYNLNKTFNALVLTIVNDGPIESKEHGYYEFAWEILSPDVMWKEGFTQDIDWR